MTEIIGNHDNVIGKKNNYFGYTTRAHISYESLKSDIQYQTSKTGKQALVSFAAKYPDTGSIENLLLIAASLGFVEIIKRTIRRISNLETRDPYGRTMLANASVNGHKEIVELLVKAGVDINTRDINGDTPLALAISRNNIEVVKALLAARADMEIKNNAGDNAFCKAVIDENIELVQILLVAGANINDRNKYNKTPLMYAIAYDHISIAELLIERCNNLDITDIRGETAIVYAAKYNQLSLIPLMIEKGAEFKSKNINLLKKYLSFNYYGEKNIDLKLVKYLLDLGTDPNLHDSFERTPLTYAVEMGNVELTEMLIQYGADANFKNYRYKSAINEAAIRGNFEIVKTLYHYTKLNTPELRRELLENVISGGNVDALKFLINKGFDIKREDEGMYSLLLGAVRSGKIEMVKFLLKLKLNINKAYYEKSALSAAASEGYLEMVNLLIQEGANINLNTFDGTALIEAAKNKQKDIVILLLKRGADASLSDYYGYTALTHAAFNNDDEIINLLKPEINVEDFKKQTSLALVLAARNYNVEIGLFKNLIEKASNINIQNTQEDTALIWASKSPRIDFVEALLKSGADPNIQGDYKYTAIDSVRSYNEEALEIIKLLLQYGAKINYHDNTSGTTVLMNCCEKLPLVKCLLKNGADPNIKDKYGETALTKATKAGEVQVVKYLLQYAEKHTWDEQQEPKALRKAIISNNPELIELFLQRVDLGNHSFRDDKSLYEWEEAFLSAYKNNAVKVISILVEKGIMPASRLLFRTLELNTNIEILEILIANCEDIDAVYLGKTLLEAAIYNNAEDITELLLKYGANPNMSGTKDDLPIINFIKCKPKGKENGLVNKTKILELLYMAGGNLNLQDKEGKTLLMTAIESEDNEVVKWILNKDVNLEIKDKDGNTALMHAIENVATELSELLIKKGADINIQNLVGYTPLIAATKNQQYYLVNVLIGLGAELERFNNEGNTALIVAAQKACPAITRMLINAKANISHTNFKGNTALIELAFNVYDKYSKAGKVAKLLLWTEESHCMTEDYKVDILMTASVTGQLSIAKQLLRFKTNINKQAEDGDTALHLAIRGGCFEIVKVLIKNKAKLNVKNNLGETPLHLAIELRLTKLLVKNGADVNAQDNIGNTPLINAISNNNLEIVKYLLENKADPNIQNKYKRVPITDLLANNPKDAHILIQLFIKHGANINIGNLYKLTPLNWAVWNKDIKSVQLLLDNGASIDARDANNRTALMQAAGDGLVEIVKLFLSKNAKLNLKNYFGETALDLAKKYNRNKIAKLLELATEDCLC